MILEKDKIIEAMEYIFADPDHHFECIQIAPAGQDRCAILFEIGDSEHEVTLSVIFGVDAFDKDRAKPLMVMDEWLFSLSASNAEDISALEVGRSIWRGAHDNWTRRNVADWFNNRLWCLDANNTFLIGEHGLSSRYDGANYFPIRPGRKTLLYDIHGLHEKSIYCVGAGGTLQHLKGEGWDPIDLALSERFRGIDATDENRLRFCGDSGRCYELRNRNELVAIEAPNSIFFTVRKFQGEVFWGNSNFGVYLQKGAELEEFHNTGLAYDLRCDGQFLYCVGTDMAWRYDGSIWRSLRLQYADGTFTLM